MVVELSGDEVVGLDRSLYVIISVRDFVSNVHHIQWVISDVEEFHFLYIVFECVG